MNSFHSLTVANSVVELARSHPEELFFRTRPPGAESGFQPRDAAGIRFLS